MSGARAVLLGLVLAVGVAVLQQGLVRLVEASGARDQPAVILVLLLAAFLGLVTAVVTRSLGLPGASAPTVLVLGWIAIPPLFGLIPAPATQLFASNPALRADEAISLVVAVLAAVVTLGVSAERR
jgi:hypothetical protein